MATMTEPDRITTWAELMRAISADGEPVAINKAELKAAVDAIDDFFDANAATLNNALPAAAKAGLTTEQKARLLMAVISHRYLTVV